MKWFLEWLSAGDNWIIVFILGGAAISGIAYLIKVIRGTE